MTLVAITETTPEASNADRHLLELYRATGDRDALGQLFERHAALAHRVACRMLGSDSDADDAVQDALVRCMHKVSEFRGDGSVRAWLLSAVVNTCRNQMR